MSKIRKVEDSKLTMFRRILELQDCIEEVKEDYTIDEVQSFIEFIDSVSLNLKTIFKIDDNTNTNEEENTKYNTTSIPKLVDQFNTVTDLVHNVGNYENLAKLNETMPYRIEMLKDEYFSDNGEYTETAKIKTENLLVYLDRKFRIVDEIALYDHNGEYLGNTSPEEIYDEEADLNIFNSSLIRQLENVTNLINHSGNFNTLFNMRKAIPYEIEVNGDVFSSYNGEEVEIVRIETENLFVYIDENFKIIDEVSVYSPEGYYINDFPRKDIYNKKISYIL